MEIGAHLPLMDFGDNPYTREHLVGYARTAAELRFDALAANDHMVFSTPWLDGLTALAAVAEHSADMTLATTVALPVVRGPIALAKALAAIDRLSDGRLVVAVGPGSSRSDYDAVGIEFDERWARLDEAVHALRALLGPGEPFTGRYYSTEGVDLAPRPTQHGGPAIWIGSWGSDAGLRRAARLGDGWLASAYNTTPRDFADARARLDAMLVERGRDPKTFPNGLATMWCYVTDDRAEAERVLVDVIVPVVNRPVELLRERLAVGTPESVAEKLTALSKSGVQRVFIWPVRDERRQLELFSERVRPAVEAATIRRRGC